MIVSGSPGLQEIAQTTVRPWEVTAQLGRYRQTQAQQLVNGFTKYVAVAQSRNAGAVAGCPLRVYRRKKSSRKTAWDIRPVLRKELLRQRSRAGAWTRKAADMSEEVDEIIDPLHPLVSVLNNANALTNGFGLLEQTQLGIGLTGNAYWYCLPGPDGYPIEVWPLPPQYVHVIPDRDTIIGGYIYGRSFEIEKQLPVENVVRFTQPNPRGDPFRGFGDLEKCILDAQLSVAFSEIRLAMIDNGAQPGLVITAKGATDDQRARLEEIVNQKFASGSKWGRTMVLNGDCTITPWGMNEKEAAFLQSDPAVRETIANCHDMSSALLTLESAALATASAAIPHWQEQGVKPRCNRIADTLNQAFVPMFGDDSLYVCFDEVVQKDAQIESGIAVSMYAGNLVTKNEARALVDFDAVPDGDKFASDYAQENAVGLLDAKPDPAKPASGSEPDDETAAESPDAEEPTKPPAKDKAFRNDAKELEDLYGEAIVKLGAKHPADCPCCVAKAKGFDPEAMSAGEAEMEAALRNWFDRLLPIYVASLTQEGVTANVLPKIAIGLSQAIDQPIMHTFVTGFNTGVQELGANAGKAQMITATGTLTSPVEAFLREYKGALIKSVTETADKAIREQLAQGVKAGETIPELTTRVQNVVGDMSRYAAERIARTETARAFGAARIESWAKSGNVWGKRIILAPNACPVCIQIAKDYGVQPLNKAFVPVGRTITLDSGQEVVFDYADVNTPPIHPQCRCDVVMVMEEPKE